MFPPLRPVLLRPVLQQPAPRRLVGLLQLAPLQGWLQLVWSRKDPPPVHEISGLSKRGPATISVYMGGRALGILVHLGNAGT